MMKIVKICEKTKNLLTAFADGKVVEVIKGKLVGWTVALSHEGKMLTRYQHMRNNSVRVKVGENIKRSQVLGVMGNTGYCVSSNTSVPPEYRGTHLHFAVKTNSVSYNTGEWVDPEPYLNGAKSISGITQSTQQPPQSSTVQSIEVNSKVKVVNAIDFSGKSFKAYHPVYDVIQIRGDGAVVIGVNGIVTAAVNMKDLLKV